MPAGIVAAVPFAREEAEEAPQRAARRVLERLVVDDEATVRMLVTDVLGGLGYTVIEAVGEAVEEKLIDPVLIGPAARITALPLGRAARSATERMSSVASWREVDPESFCLEEDTEV